MSVPERGMSFGETLGFCGFSLGVGLLAALAINKFGNEPTVAAEHYPNMPGCLQNERIAPISHQAVLELPLSDGRKVLCTKDSKTFQIVSPPPHS